MLDFENKAIIIIDWHNYAGSNDIKVLHQLIIVNNFLVNYDGYQIIPKSGSYNIYKIVDDLNQIILYLNINNITWISQDVKFNYYICFNKVLTIKDNKAVVINA